LYFPQHYAYAYIHDGPKTVSPHAESKIALNAAANEAIFVNFQYQERPKL